MEKMVMMFNVSNTHAAGASDRHAEIKIGARSAIVNVDADSHIRLMHFAPLESILQR
jgi:hypothetical protein